ncbi:uncharacterized protein G2W53_036040 [Senna tora]|uniref:Uncharacterized protein n=1 Tax=Senna tora TaxID=362788 RepID=A0A834SWQ9_9FABA|nr:uncharacterized protein G2W53_036040 [Senna tora]
MAEHVSSNLAEGVGPHKRQNILGNKNIAGCGGVFISL